jgi:hypothetical protein
MPGYSLVPVDYQPDFEGVSLVPVDYDPFAADGGTHQAQSQQAQPQGPPQQQPATGAGQPDAGAPAAGGGPGGSEGGGIGPAGGAPNPTLNQGAAARFSGYSLVPVDYQPDFSDYTLVPVDYNPFAAEDAIQQARAQLASQPQRLAAGAGQPNVGAPANNAQAAASGESHDPDSDSVSGVPQSGQPYNPSAAPISPPGAPVLANQQQPGDISSPGPASGGDGSSFWKSLLQGTINAAVPGAYHSGLAQQQFRQGNYGAAALYGAESLGDAALGVATLGASARLGAAARAAKTMVPATVETAAGNVGRATAGSAARQAIAEAEATLPEGISRKQFGRLAGFAQGPAASSQASTEATAEIISRLKSAGITSRSIAAFQKLYEGVASENPSNLSAIHRAALLTNILRSFQ